MKFAKDIFVSYAHIDNESLVEGEKGWVSEFHRSLEIRLSQLLGEKPKIWRDTSLDGNHRFTEEIEDQFSDVALLVSVISPRYVNSDWCIKEVEGFLEASKKNIGQFINNKSRIFKVVKTPVSLEKHPDDIKGLLGYDFFKIDTETKRVKELGKILGQESQQEYWSKLDDIAHDISNLLTEIKDETQSSLATGPSVYLSETSFDKKEERDRVKRWLQESHCRVYPDQNLSLIGSVYQSEVSEMMAQCDLSIHLLGANYGLVPEGTTLSKIEIQSQEAGKQGASKNMSRIYWKSGEDEVTDERQIVFLERLDEGTTLRDNAEYIVAPLEELKFTIEESLTRILNKKEVKDEKVEADEDSSPSQVYLICDERDLEEVAGVEDYLFDNGCNVILPAFEGDQSELRLDHQENLKSCDAVIIYYGNGNDLWVRSKLRDLMKIKGYGRQNPLLHKAVLLAGNTTPQKQRFRSHDLSVINMLDENDNSKLNAFIQPLSQ